ncbi:hypothetical protein OF117_11460 [Geodermatophilus sp. YIM 151500]|uniref:hypothetical protein n=1 Tax=Geodermatophilus sp. YIM 151500 TaxID=2984531 RepID=UPI0021E43A81|nr:hypothetical protein [Geodermatophilus sp. YIM 151500]MCV2489977.1 hypothetical protein [Geodermatophilus sp. YIM 151500]
MAYDLSGHALYPLSDLLDGADFLLVDFLTDAGIFESIYYTDVETYGDGDTYCVSGRLAFESELVLRVPGTDAVELVIASGGQGWSSFEVELVTGPQPSLALVEVPLALRFSEDVLRDVATGGPAQLGLEATLRLSGDLGMSIETTAGLSLDECEIAGSGVTLEAQNVTWNFTPGETLPDAVRAGLPGEFIGIAFRETTVRLPADIVDGPELTFDYCCIGTSGFTGGVSLSFQTPPACTLGGFSIELERVGIRFFQSSLVLGEIETVVKDVDFFDTDVAVDLQLSGNGRLRLALATAADRMRGGAEFTDGLVTLRKPDVVAMTLTSVAVEVGPTGGALTLGGRVQPEISLPGGGPLPGFEVEALTITSRGQVSLAGGWIDMPEAVRVGLGGFGLELTRVGMGSEPNGERWIGFSGGLSLVQGVAAQAAVDGLKIRWDATGFKGVELSGISFGLMVQDVLVLQAEIRYVAEQQRFEGAGTLQLVAVNLTVSVRVVIGKRADYTYLYVYLLVQLPAGIPLFSTSLGIYGFEGLYARNMVPDKESAERWYRDWYRRPEIGAADQNKWADERGSQAFGAGVIIGTVADTGYSVAVKGLLVIVVPGPVLMLDVRANLLRKMSEIAAPQAQALFGSLIVFDGRAGTLELGIEPHYLYPGKGELVDVTGIAEAFYSFNDPRAWYLYLGRREREQRIRASVLKLFEANAYLMLDANSIELGSFIGFDARYDIGPVRLTLQAWIDGFAYVSWRPKQLKGKLSLQGAVGLSIFGIGLGLSVSAMVAVQSPQPFMVDAQLDVRLDLPWPLPDPGVTIPFHWEDPGPPRVTAPLQAAGVEHLRTTASWSFETVPTVPLDGRISLAFERPVEDAVEAAPNAESPVDLTVGDHILRSRLTGLQLDVEDPATGAFVPFAGPSGKPRPLYGMWQRQAGDPASGNRRLLLHVRTPYEWTRAQTEPAVTQLEQAEGFDPCQPSLPTEVIDFHDEPERQLPPLAPIDAGTVTWTAGRHGASITQLVAATLGRDVRQPPPRPYDRCLYVPDQFALAPGGGGSSPSTGAGPPTASAPPLAMEFDGPLKGLVVLALITDRWSLQAFDASGASLGKVTAPSPPAPGQFHASQLVLRAPGIRRVVLDCFQRSVVLALAVERAPTSAQVSARRVALEQALERFKGEEPIFEPNRHYRLTVTTQVVETGGRSLEGAEVDQPDGAMTTIHGATCTVVQAFEFCTEGPPGAAKLTAPGPGGDAAAGLDTLEPYVREITPPRGAPAVYRGHDLGVAFNSDYVDQMYCVDGRALVLRARNDGGSDVTLTNTMGKGTELVLRREERTWLATLDRASCHLTVDESALVRESVVKARLPGSGPLDPRRRYDVELLAEPVPGRGGVATPPLYRWSFVTSAYRNFADHLRLTGPIRLASVGATWAQWSGVVAKGLASDDPWTADPGRRDQLRVVEAAVFDELIGAVDVDRSLPAAVELHVAMAGGETWAMLLASPEPFDWERVRIALTHRVTQPDAGRPTWLRVPVPLRLIRDADGTRALLVAHDGPSTVALDAGEYLMRATYKRDLGSGRPVLSERGSTLDEHVVLDWTLPVA